MLIALDIYYSSILLVIHHTTAYIQVNPSIIRLTHRSKMHLMCQREWVLSICMSVHSDVMNASARLHLCL